MFLAATLTIKSIKFQIANYSIDFMITFRKNKAKLCEHLTVCQFETNAIKHEIHIKITNRNSKK
jgi:hypothetical protein